MKLYAIYDKVSEEHAPLFCVKTHRDAVNVFKQTFREVDYVRDFELHYFADYDLKTGAIHVLKHPGNYEVVDVPYDEISKYSQQNLFTTEEIRKLKEILNGNTEK